MKITNFDKKMLKNINKNSNPKLGWAKVCCAEAVRTDHSSPSPSLLLRLCKSKRQTSQ